jgi:hypothetical protein
MGSREILAGTLRSLMKHAGIKSQAIQSLTLASAAAINLVD